MTYPHDFEAHGGARRFGAGWPGAEGPGDRPRRRRDDFPPDDEGGREHRGHGGAGRGRGRGRGGFGGPGGPADPRGEFAGFGGPGFEGPGFGGPEGRGFGPAFGPGFAPGGRGPGGRRGHGRGRAQKGDVRAAILVLLSESPMHGYQIIQEIAERSSGLWRPSPGAVYPALSMLEDEGLVSIATEGGRKLASLTDAGRTYVTEHADSLGDPFKSVTSESGRQRLHDVREAMASFGGALQQVMRTGSESQVTRAVELLNNTRRELYLILAEADQPADRPAGEPADDAAYDEPQDAPRED